MIAGFRNNSFSILVVCTYVRHISLLFIEFLFTQNNDLCA